MNRCTERFKPSLQDQKLDFLYAFCLNYFQALHNRIWFFIVVLKLLKMATGMRALLDTVVQALPQVSPQISSMPSLFPLVDCAFQAWGQLCATGFGWHEKPPEEDISFLCCHQCLGSRVLHGTSYSHSVC